MPLGGGPSVTLGVLARREGRPVVRSTGWALGASGLAGAGGPSPFIVTSSSQLREGVEWSSEWGGGSCRGGGMGLALHSLEKASWSHPQ